MSDLISRQAVIDAIDNVDWYSQNSKGEMVSGAYFKHQAWYKANDIYKALENLLSAQPEPKKGKWMCWHEKIENDSCTEYIPHCKCSECGTEYDSHTVKFINFCPNCGADMRGEDDENNRC